MPATKYVHYRDLPGLVGTELPTSDWVLIDQAMVDAFGKLTFDTQWIHMDVPRATKEIGGTIAHGFLTMSLMSKMAMEIMRVDGLSRAINYGFDKVRFTGVVPVGASVRMTSRIIAVTEKSGGRLITRDCAVQVRLADGKMADRPALVGEWHGLVFPAAS